MIERRTERGGVILWFHSRAPLFYFKAGRCPGGLFGPYWRLEFRLWRLGVYWWRNV